MAALGVCVFKQLMLNDSSCVVNTFQFVRLNVVHICSFWATQNLRLTRFDALSPNQIVVSAILLWEHQLQLVVDVSLYIAWSRHVCTVHVSSFLAAVLFLYFACHHFSYLHTMHYSPHQAATIATYQQNKFHGYPLPSATVAICSLE